MLSYSEIINANQLDLFELTQDYSQRLAWDPFPESYSFINQETIDKGLRVSIKSHNGLSMDVEYVSFKKPVVVAITMIRGPFFIRKFAGSWSFKKIDENITRVTFKYTIVGKPRFLSPFIRYSFLKTTKNRLMALKIYAESNQ